MDFHPWFQQLRKALQEERVSKRYADRLISELWNHYLEIQEQDAMNGVSREDSSRVEQLGSPNILAMQASRVQKTTWGGRHPWLTFIFGAPVLTLALIALVCFVSVLAITPFAQGKTLATDPWMGPVMTALGPMQVILPSIIAAVLICRAVHRSIRSTWWAVASCCLIALLSGMTVIQWSAPESVPGTGQVSMGFSVPFFATWYQSIAPLLIATIYAYRNASPRKPVSDVASEAPLRSAA